MSSVSRVFCVALAFCAIAACGAEYFVEKSGSDSNDGLSRESAFLTIGRAARSFKAGDTLTIGPGEYAESTAIELETSPELRTVIRAGVKGATLLRGDREVGGFEKVEGRRFVWSAEWAHLVETVNERDTLTTYVRAVSVAEMDSSRGAWLLDSAGGRLYVVTSDGEPPRTHNLTVSVDRGFGLLLSDSGDRLHNVVVDGLSFTGFNCSESVQRPGNQAIWGLLLLKPSKSVVRNCRAFLNGGGLGMMSPEDSVIEDSIAYGNGSPFAGSGGNIICYSKAERSVIRRCVSFGSVKAGIRFYGGNGLYDCLIEDCVAWGNGYGDVWIKGVQERCRTRNVVAPGGLASSDTLNNVYGYNTYFDKDPTSLNLSRNKLRLDESLADPDRMDYRPMGDSAIEGGLPYSGDVFFVSPGGDDGASGDSIRAPWRSLSNARAGSTIYLLPGEYSGEQVITERGVTVRTRGSGASAVFRGGRFGIELAGEDCALENISFVGFTEAGVRITADNARVDSCGFAETPAGVSVAGAEGVALSHNALASSVGVSFRVAGGGGVVRDNLLAGAADFGGGEWVVYNNWRAGRAGEPEPDYADSAAGDFSLRNAAEFSGRGSDGFALGPYRMIRGRRPVKITGPFVSSVTATTANIEWWTSSDGVTSELRWGEDEDCIEKGGSAYTESAYHTVSLTGLRPGGRYYFRVDARAPAFEIHSNLELEAVDRQRKRENIRSEAYAFTTLAADASPREYFVAMDGDDTGAGGAESPWRTIARALGEVVAGDTLTIRGGVYQEQLFLRSTGDAGKPIVIRGAAGEKVWLDGMDQLLEKVFVVSNKSHIEFRNLYIRDLVSTKHGAFILHNSDDITLDGIFYDGRALNYCPPMIAARFCRRLTMRNCLVTRGFHGVNLFRCPDFRAENNVFYLNLIYHLEIWNMPEESLHFARNIFFDNTMQKARVPLIALWHLESLKEDNRNCFYVRLPETMRSLYGYARLRGELLPERRNLTLSELNALGIGGEPSFIANPRVPALDELISFPDLETWEKTWNTPPMRRRHQLEEYKKIYGTKPKDTFAPFDFPDFVAENPLCGPGEDGMPVGLNMPRGRAD